jgi:hypothetical protein
MRSSRRTIASLLAEALAPRAGTNLPQARLLAVKAAFAEACGHGLSREAAVWAVAHDGRLVVVARSAEWAREIERLADPICAKVNARLGARIAAGLAVRVGPLSPDRP